MPPLVEQLNQKDSGFVDDFEGAGYNLEWFGDYLNDFYEYVRQVSERESEYKNVIKNGKAKIILYRIFELVMREKSLINFGIEGKLYDIATRMTSWISGATFSYKVRLARERNIDINNPETAKQYDALWSLAEDFVTRLHI